MKDNLGKIAVVLSCLLFVVGCSATSSHQRPVLESITTLEQGARIAYTAGDFLSAEAYLHQLLEHEPSFAEGWFLLGNLHLRQHRFVAAQRAYEHALRLAPEHTLAWHNLAITQLRIATATLVESRRLGPLYQPELLEWLLQLQGAVSYEL
ncbi:tetratricopeptide repeat protein [Aliidiomarina halalkaliphila]|uniref:Tetratricopeptide repeat protein n=1 Tax=Aliidiomarina halalkaliphila TaxID=2593535 RepID=A0A552X380_9GAMM|nr:tetratricopeptide repeat protein [Aliidiomarina halalkaliphila]TRW49482.1 tetratricopeptide repeat protein [Aliidiomarina halalkaliphila]